jgi:Tfp pilus assembly protein FimT
MRDIERPSVTAKNHNISAIRVAAAGVTLLELCLVLAISITLTAVALPITKDVLNNYRLTSAVASATWAVQSIRFQALEEGYPFQVTFQGNASGYNPTYQPASEPVGTGTFSNVGSAVPLSGSAVQINETTVLQFKPNGTVTMTSGGNPVTTFQISYQGLSHTIKVTNYGNVSVTTP